MVVRETSSGVVNLLIMVICDSASTLDLIAKAADLIALDARANALMLSAKNESTERETVDFVRIASVNYAIYNNLLIAWREREKTGDLSGVAAVIQTSIDEQRAAMSA